MSKTAEQGRMSLQGHWLYVPTLKLSKTAEQGRMSLQGHWLYVPTLSASQPSLSKMGLFFFFGLEHLLPHTERSHCLDRLPSLASVALSIKCECLGVEFCEMTEMQYPGSCLLGNS